jgi:alkylation response protein AidB-like acyl-CoA dehydrogenase
MNFAWPESVEAVRKAVRAVLEEAWPEELRLYSFNEQIARDLHGAETVLRGVDEARIRHLWRELGRADLFRIGVPEAMGGVGGGALERYAVESEVAAAGAPFPSVAIGVVLPTLLSIRRSELGDHLLPQIFAGEVEFAIGYTEPEAGTDLAALRTTATRDGDHYVVRGQKLFTSGAHYSEHLWAAVRTDTTVSNHAGISLLVIPMDTPGVSVTPLHTMSGTQTNIVFLDDVRVPVSFRVGEENRGWHYITHALAHERYTSLLSAPLTQAYAALTRAVGSTSDPVTLERLAQLRAAVRAASLLSVRAAWKASTGATVVAEAAMSKVAVSELRHELAREAIDLLGADGLLTERNEDAPVGGQFERMLRHSYITLFTAGANDVQRDLIARLALGLPRSRV